MGAGFSLYRRRVLVLVVNLMGVGASGVGFEAFRFGSSRSVFSECRVRLAFGTVVEDVLLGFFRDQFNSKK